MFLSTAHYLLILLYDDIIGLYPLVSQMIYMYEYVWHTYVHELVLTSNEVTWYRIKGGETDGGQVDEEDDKDDCDTPTRVTSLRPCNTKSVISIKNTQGAWWPVYVCNLFVGRYGGLKKLEM